ncbi:MAG: inositol 2-dehydrogenase [Acidimicrobiales bacterium]
MQDSMRVVVLGTGRIGKMHAELVSRQVDGAELVGVYDVMSAAADSVAADLGVEAFDSLEAALAANADAVAVCTSTDTHVDVMVEAARAGRAIMCEKPISLSIAEVDRGLAAVAQAGVLLQIGFNRRFDASHQAVAHAVADGKVGEPHLVRITSRDPSPPPIEYIAVSGGLFNDMTIHDFDMARYVTGSEVVEVYAKGTVLVDPAIGEAGDIDTAVILLTHENGAMTTIDNSRQAVYGYDQRVEVFGSLGMVASDNPLETTTVFRDRFGAASATLPYFFLDRYTASYISEWDGFVAALRDGSPSLVSGADGRAPLVIGMAAAISHSEGRPVRIDEIDPLTS